MIGITEISAIVAAVGVLRARTIQKEEYAQQPHRRTAQKPSYLNINQRN